MKSIKKIFLSIFLLLTFLGIVACDNMSAIKVEKYDNEVVNIAVNDLSNGKFNPLFAEDETDKAICDIVYEPLFHYNDGKIEPILIENIEVSNDGLSYYIKLKEGVKWHNTLEFTSNDVEQTMKFALRYTNNIVYYHNLSNIVGVDEYIRKEVESIYGIQKINKNSLKINIKKKDDDFFEKLSKIYILQAHQIASAQKDNSIGYDLLWLKPIGTGPYYVSKFEEEQSVELIRNEIYYGNISNITKYIFHATNDEFAKKSFLNDDMNIITDIILNDEDNIDYLKKNAILEENNNYINQVVITNNSSKYLSNKFVRKALMYALERDIFLNIFSYANDGSNININNKGYAESLNIYEYNPSKSIEILTKIVGWQYINGKMFCNNEQVKLEFLYTNSDKASKFCYPMIRENLERIGIEVNAVLVNSKELHRRLKMDLYDLALYSIISRDTYGFYDYVCYYDKKESKNYSNYSNSVVEKLVNTYYITKSEQDLNRIYDILNDDVPIIYLFKYKNKRVISQNLNVIKSNSISDYFSIDKWNIVN